jgi:nitrile hydratase
MTLAAGTRVRVRDDYPELRAAAHIRTPHYVRGMTGIVVRHLGDYPNPEALAFARPAARVPLYHVLFRQPDIWQEGATGDEVEIELFEHWLEAA